MKLLKISRIIVIIILLILTLIAAGAALFIYFYPRDQLLKVILKRTESSISRKVSASELKYSLRGIVLRKIRIYDGMTETDGLLADADEARVKLSLYDLLNKEINITFIQIDHMNINIKYDREQSNLGRFIRELNRKRSDTTYSTNLSHIVLEKARINLKNPPAYLKPLEGLYVIDTVMDFSGKQGIFFRDIRIVLPEKRGVITSDLVLTFPQEGFLLKGEARLDRCQLPWVYRWGNNLSLPFLNFAGIVKDLQIRRTSVRGKARGASNLTNGRTLNVDGSCVVDFSRDELTIVTITDTEGSVRDSKVFLKELIIPTKGDIRRMALSRLEVDLADTRNLLPFIPPGAFGNISGSFTFERNVYWMNLELKDAGVDRDSGLISDINDTFTMKANVFRKENLKMKVMDNPCTVSLASTDGKLRKMIVNLKAGKFKIPETSSGESGGRPKGIGIPGTVIGRINIDNLAHGKIDLNQLDISYTLTGRQLIVNRFSAKTLGGEAEGRATIDLVKDNPPVTVAFAYNRIKVQNIAKLSEKSKGRLFGTASGNAELSFRLQKEKILPTLRGKVEFNIIRGKVANTGIQNGLGIWLSELKYKLKDMEFNKIYGNVALQGENFHINTFTFNAPDVKLNVDGDLTKELKGSIRLNLSFTRRFIQDLPNPVLLQMNRYKKGDWYNFLFEARGDDVTNSKNIKRIH